MVSQWCTIDFPNPLGYIFAQVPSESPTGEDGNTEPPPRKGGPFRYPKPDDHNGKVNIPIVQTDAMDLSINTFMISSAFAFLFFVHLKQNRTNYDFPPKQRKLIIVFSPLYKVDCFRPGM